MTSNVLQDNNIILDPTVAHSRDLSEVASSTTSNLHFNGWRIWHMSSWRRKKSNHNLSID